MGGGKTGSAEERRYAEASRASRQFMDAPGGDRPRVHVLGPVRHAARYNRAFRWVRSDEREDIVRLKIRLDVTGFVVILDDQHVAHAFRQHGDRTVEAKRGQIAVNWHDYTLLPRIIGDPDVVEPGETGQRGGPRVVLIKVIDRIRYTVILEARVRRQPIAFLTMFKSRESV